MTTRSIQKTIILLKQSNAIYLVSPFINLSTVKISAAVSLSSGNVADAIASSTALQMAIAFPPSSHCQCNLISGH
jgi:hypothetical protein